MMDEKTYNKMVAANLRRIMYERAYTFHSLRHFFASYLHAQHIPDAYVLRAGGWSTPHVMQKVYRHALDNEHLEYSQKAVSAFQNPFQDK